MCKQCVGCCMISAIATWGFFALLLKLLNVANAGVNAVWLTLLILVAVCCCFLMNPKLAQCCIGPKKKK